jgi:hypothetical protein
LVDGSTTTAATPSSTADDASAELWRSATTQVRDTIKYVIAGFAAVGAIMVGTAPLAGLGKVFGWWWWVAGIGGALAIAGVIVAVWRASDVLLPEVVTLDQVQAAEAGTELARFRDVVLGGPEGMLQHSGGDIPGFRQERAVSYTTLDNIDLKIPADDAERQELTAARPVQVKNIEMLNSTAVTALAGAQYAATKDLARTARFWIGAAALAVAGGVGLFTVAVNRERDTSGTAKTTPASAAAISFTAAGKKDFADVVGAACADPAPALVLDGATTGPWEVVTTGEGGCRAARFSLRADQGEPVYVGAERVTVTLTKAGKARLGPVLGDKCVAKPFVAIKLGGSERVELLSQQTAQCNAVRFTLSSDDGRVGSKRDMAPKH